MSERTGFLASDGTRLSATWDAPATPGDSGVLILPGFWRRAESPRIRELALELARRFPVLTLDFRGHGLSRGSFTFGCCEHLDVEASFEEMARRGIRRAAVVGLSMGGSAGIVTLGRGAPLALEPVAMLSIAAPCEFGLIRPAPWRGHRDVAWADAWRLPRPSMAGAFGAKLVPRDLAAGLPPIPVRLVHGREDWLVHHSHAEALHGARPEGAELLVVEERGAHADELLARVPGLMLRLVRPFVAAALAPVAGPAPDGEEIDAGPWLAALESLLRDPSRHAGDLGGLPPRGSVERVRAFAAPDGAHLAFRAGSDIAWARGLRDGSAFGLNLLATQIVTDGVAWSPGLRRALAGALSELAGMEPTSRWQVQRRGEEGMEVLAGAPRP